MRRAGRVLVVDDDDDIRGLVCEVLGAEGYSVLDAPHGAAALALVAVDAPCLILLDMRMPVMDGRAFATAYRRLPQPHAAIVCMTAEAEAGRQRELIDADAALGKPFDLSDLLRVVEQYCEPD